MNKLWINDYNELVAAKESAEWQSLSRQNFYRFETKNGTITIDDIIKDYKIRTIIDYGCGEGNDHLTQKQKITVYNYDPFVDKFKNPPTEKADMVVCYNVLNVIELDVFDNVLRHILSFTDKVAAFNVKIMGMYGRPALWYIKHMALFDDSFVIKETYQQNKDADLYILMVNKNVKKEQRKNVKLPRMRS